MPRRAFFLITFSLILLALLLGDRSLKRGPILGYSPSDADWVAVSDDFGMWWGNVSAMNERSGFFPNGPVNDWALLIRKTLGIRPTPARWNFWLGKQFVASGNEHGTGVCLRPGLLLRIARVFASSDDAIGHYGEHAYFWKEDFLFVSTSTSFIEALSEQSLDPVPFVKEDNAIKIQRYGDRPWELHLTARSDLPVSGWIAHEAVDLQTLDRVVLPWTDASLVGLSVSHGSLLRDIVTNSVEFLPYGELLAPLLDEVNEALGGINDEGPCSLLLLGMDFSESLAVPELGFFSPIPAVKGLAPTGSIPFVWQDRDGWLMPWMGEKVAFAVSTHEDYVHLYTRESLMANVSPDVAFIRQTTAHVALQVNWQRLMPVVRRVVADAAALELIPRMNAEDVESRLLPYLEVGPELGEAVLRGQQESERITFSGYLSISPLETQMAEGNS